MDSIKLTRFVNFEKKNLKKKTHTVGRRGLDFVGKSEQYM